jgi:hypothetical protein
MAEMQVSNNPGTVWAMKRTVTHPATRSCAPNSQPVNTLTNGGWKWARVMMKKRNQAVAPGVQAVELLHLHDLYIRLEPVSALSWAGIATCQLLSMAMEICPKLRKPADALLWKCLDGIVTLLFRLEPPVPGEVCRDAHNAHGLGGKLLPRGRQVREYWPEYGTNSSMPS